MRFGWPISVSLHLFLAAASWIVFSRSVVIDPESKVIPVQIATISEISNVRASVKKPKTTPKTEQPMTLQSPMESAEEKGAPKPVEKTAEASIPDIIPDETVELEIEQPEPEPEKPAFDLDRFAAVIDKTRETQPEIGQQQALQSEDNFYVSTPTPQAVVGAGSDLTISEIDALKQKMYQCWRIPVDAKNPAELIVAVRVKMRNDGTVMSASLHEPLRVANSSNPFMSVAARRAVNAVRNCGPYDFLPIEKYSQWQDMVLRFIPEV